MILLMIRTLPHLLIKFLGLCFLTLLFSACTWNSKKDLAMDAAKAKIETELLSEAKTALENKPVYWKKYAATILSKTEFEVIKEEGSGDNLTLEIKAKMIPAIARQTLKEVFAKQNVSRETNINGSEALSLVLKELKMTSENFIDQIITVKLKKETEWKIESAK